MTETQSFTSNKRGTNNQNSKKSIIGSNGRSNSKNDNQRKYNRTVSSGNKKIQYPDHKSIQNCLERYANKDKNLIRGKLRVIPGGAMAFVSCDRGSYSRDVVIDGEKMRLAGCVRFINL